VVGRGKDENKSSGHEEGRMREKEVEDVSVCQRWML
jgi:hypothetical protein